jgi:hypothetical protein
LCIESPFEEAVAADQLPTATGANPTEHRPGKLASAFHVTGE